MESLEYFVSLRFFELVGAQTIRSLPMNPTLARGKAFLPDMSHGEESSLGDQ